MFCSAGEDLVPESQSQVQEGRHGGGRATQVSVSADVRASGQPWRWGDLALPARGVYAPVAGPAGPDPTRSLRQH